MRFRGAGCIEYGGTVTGARSGTTPQASRRGVLFRVTTEDGITGQGEGSPLPGYSPDTLVEVWAALSALDVASLPGWEANERGLAYLDRLAAAVPSMPPAARFALETAVLDAIGNREGRPVWSLLSDGAANEAGVPVSAYAGGADEATVVEASRAAVQRGFSTIKVKITGPVLGPQRDALAVVRGAIGGAALRLDANQTLHPSTAREELAALAALSPELVEEPVSADALAGLASPVAIALDESLRSPGALERIRPHLGRIPCVAVVLKPMVLGGFAACARHAAAAVSAGLDVTVSHLFDGPVALAASRHLALAVASRSRASGLAVHGGLAAWPPVFTGPEPTILVAGSRPGLGAAPIEEIA